MNMNMNMNMNLVERHDFVGVRNGHLGQRQPPSVPFGDLEMMLRAEPRTQTSMAVEFLLSGRQETREGLSEVEVETEMEMENEIQELRILEGGWSSPPPSRSKMSIRSLLQD
jgi:hypothetical protein